MKNALTTKPRMRKTSSARTCRWAKASAALAWQTEIGGGFSRRVCRALLIAPLALCVALAATPALAETVCYFSGGTRSGNTYTIGPRIDTGKKYALTDSLSMSAWVRVSPNITTVKPSGPGRTYVNYYAAPIAGQGFYGEETGFGFFATGFDTLATSDDKLSYQVRIKSPSTAVGDSYKDATLFTADKWHHYLLVRDQAAGKSRFYVDGELLSETNCPSEGNLTPSQNFAIAFNPNGNGGSFCGYIADLALWDVALSAEDAECLPRRGPKRVSTAPIAYFPLDEGWGDGVKEFCGSITNYHSATGTLEWKVVPDFVSKLGMIIIVR